MTRRTITRPVSGVDGGVRSWQSVVSVIVGLGGVFGVRRDSRAVPPYVAGVLFPKCLYNREGHVLLKNETYFVV